MDTVREEKLMELARRFLNEVGVDEVEEYLAHDNEKTAKAYILGAVDRAAKEQTASDEELRCAYEVLGVPREEATRIRQGKTHLWDS